MEDDIRSEIIKYCKLLYDRKLVVSSDGNVSARVAGGQIWITSESSYFGTVTESDIVKIDFLGNVLQGDKPPSFEYRMHVEAYKRRKDVNAVVHTHSPYATAFSAVDAELEPILSEVAFFGGLVPKTWYAPPHTEELATAISRLVETHNAMLLRNHGALAVGKSVSDAFLTAERLEFVAQVAVIARQMGGLRKLSVEQLARLDAIFKA
jgi:L-fuculose-phosphate aldolase